MRGGIEGALPARPADGRVLERFSNGHVRGLGATGRMKTQRLKKE